VQAEFVRASSLRDEERMAKARGSSLWAAVRFRSVCIMHAASLVVCACTGLKGDGERSDPPDDGSVDGGDERAGGRGDSGVRTPPNSTDGGARVDGGGAGAGGSASSEPEPNDGGRTNGEDASALDAGAVRFAIAVVGTACASELDRACTGHNSLDKLVCDGNTWRSAGSSCDGNDRCDTLPGISQGTCQPAAVLCVGKAGGEPVCDGDVRKRCDPDLLRYEPYDCAEHALCAESGGVHCACQSGYEDDGLGGCADIDDCSGAPCGSSPNLCVDAVGGYACTCGAGFTGTGTTECTDIDECSTSHGGCDALVTCTNTTGGRTCGQCPVGYRGTGESGCIPLWTQQFGSTADDSSLGVATDTSGNVYTVGSAGGSLDGSPSSDLTDLFLVKNRGNGQREWTRQLRSGADDSAVDVTTDVGGNVYVLGTTWGTLSANPGGGALDVVVVKYDGAGTLQWIEQVGAAELEFAGGIATDASGNVYVAGSTQGALHGNASAGMMDMFVAKYDAAGQRQWTRQLGSSEWDYGWAIASNANGDVYVAAAAGGSFTGEPSVKAGDQLLLKYDSAGERLWIRAFDSGDDLVVDVASDATGRVYVAGYTAGALDGNPSAGGYDPFVIAYDGAGNKRWSRQFGSTANDYAEGIATDPSGNVYLAGYTAGGMDGNASAGSYDLFVAKYDGSGQPQWTRQLGTSAEDQARSVATDVNGNVFLAGRTYGGLDGINNAGGADVCVVKYDGEGSRL
jgi:hypothetical protein